MTQDQNSWMNLDDAREAAVKHLVENTDLSLLQAKELVEKQGVVRGRLIEIAKTMKAEG